jgi:nucleoid-associated protein YgaU
LDSAKNSLSYVLGVNKDSQVAEKMFYRLILKENSFDKLSVLYLYNRKFPDQWVKEEIVATLKQKDLDKIAVKTEVSTRGPASLEHVVQRGETLRLISLNYFGTKERWSEIYHLNSNLISNMNVLPVGVKLKLPN